jgi:hypothetical protein
VAHQIAEEDTVTEHDELSRKRALRNAKKDPNYAGMPDGLAVTLYQHGEEWKQHLKEAAAAWDELFVDVAAPSGMEVVAAVTIRPPTQSTPSRLNGSAVRRRREWLVMLRFRWSPPRLKMAPFAMRRSQSPRPTITVSSSH